MNHPPLPASQKIAITGGIACGKSLAGAYLQQKGIPVIDTDAVAHRLLKEDFTLKAQIVAAFGTAVLDADGQIHRPTLGNAVFADEALRHQLERWLHPKIREQVTVFFELNAAQPRVVALIPLLFESGIETLYDAVWLLDSDEALQIDRLKASRGMTDAEALARIRNQLPVAEKRRRTQAHPGGVILENNGAPEALYTQMDRLLA